MSGSTPVLNNTNLQIQYSVLWIHIHLFALSRQSRLDLQLHLLATKEDLRLLAYWKNSEMRFGNFFFLSKSGENRFIDHNVGQSNDVQIRRDKDVICDRRT